MNTFQHHIQRKLNYFFQQNIVPLDNFCRNFGLWYFEKIQLHNLNILSVVHQMQMSLNHNEDRKGLHTRRNIDLFYKRCKQFRYHHFHDIYPVHICCNQCPLILHHILDTMLAQDYWKSLFCKVNNFFAQDYWKCLFCKVNNFFALLIVDIGPEHI